MEKLFIPCYLKKDIILGEKIFREIEKYEKIALFTTYQHLNQLAKTKNVLEDEGKKVVFSGQILGCESEKIKNIKDKTDAFLYLGSGKFHPLNIATKTEKPVFVFDPYSETITEISAEEKKKHTARRNAAIAKALSAETFGILISTKTKQFHFEKALKIKNELEKRGKKAYLFVGEELSPDRVLGFQVDVWINTACPRIIEDYFDKPVLNPDELALLYTSP